MSMFRAKKLDLGCFTNIKIIRDHSKRKAFEAAEPERCGHHHPRNLPSSPETVVQYSWNYRSKNGSTAK